ncbi:sporulation protein [Embleya hyalina]|uniref:Sporulation protein n=1 Tax=Embleya hyalina TaxID=516124 RepID=A0A401YK32_9ACTN|nr:sporulation protein [Embleya hyalina]GCD94965.1 sporulation protein [Embleya hyalina]
MVFNRVLDAIGVGAPDVRTALSTPMTRPGGTLRGGVVLVGGGRPAEVGGVTLSLVLSTAAGIGRPAGAGDGSIPFADVVVSGPLRLAAREERELPFSFPVPWAAPFTTIAGQRLANPVVGLRTLMALDAGRRRHAVDAVDIDPLPVQQRVLEAALALGFTFKDADPTMGRFGAEQDLPFRQEVAFHAAPRYADRCREVALSFRSTPNATHVSVRVGPRGEPFGLGLGVDTGTRLDHTDLSKDLAGTVDTWIRRAVEEYAARTPYGGSSYDATRPSPWVNTGAEAGSRGGGSGLGGMVGGMATGAAAGFLGGMLAEEVFGDDD